MNANATASGTIARATVSPERISVLGLVPSNERIIDILKKIKLRW